MGAGGGGVDPQDQESINKKGSYSPKIISREGPKDIAVDLRILEKVFNKKSF